MPEFPKNYSPTDHEDAIYKKWEESGLFSPDSRPDATETYANILPPPNANGNLHLGHSSGYAVMDLIARTRRMQGAKTLMLPGKDHAGIMTQLIYEKELAKEGKTRHDLGREEFYKQTYDFSLKNSDHMRNQEKKMGLSADWDREKFTLGPEISKQVMTTFVKMYKDGLIYRGPRIVNWDPQSQTSISDIEVKYVKEKTKFYYFKYGPVTIGTARPETKFLDKVIVVHPDDDRYKDLVGKELEVEWINGPIKAQVIADEAADPEFGSGAMTITPAHSFEDFEIAQKHDLEIVNIIGEDGCFTDVVGEEFAGKNARASRDAIVAKLEAKGLVERVDEDYEHNLSVSERSGAPVEPLVSTQWFVNVDHKKFSLKSKMRKAIENEDVKLFPANAKSIFLRWIDELHDWNISRQLWWGHQIPAWYKDGDKTTEPVVQLESPGPEYKQDPDTFDTWFSSGQWAYTTLGFDWEKKWSKQPEDIKTFYPSDLMVMGRDILLFWAARMLMMSLYSTKQVPFKRVYFTGLVRDKNGQKMSKSKNNGIDPLESIKKYGTDALRLSMLSGNTAGTDYRLYDEKIEGYRNFVNKLWNIARFVEGRKSEGIVEESELTTADKWILSRLQSVIAANTKDLDLDVMNISEPVSRMYSFLWDDFADWYLEIKKIEDPEGKSNVILEQVLETSLRLLHPYIPFVTEELWERMGHDTMLMGESWPEADDSAIDADIEDAFDQLQEAVRAIRNIRAEYEIGPKEAFVAYLPYDGIFVGGKDIIERLATVKVEYKFPSTPLVTRAVGKHTIRLDIASFVDVKKEVTKAEKEQGRLEGFIAGLDKKLSNEKFVANAPEEVVQKEKDKLETQRAKLLEVQKRIEEINNLKGN